MACACRPKRMNLFLKSNKIKVLDDSNHTNSLPAILS